MAGMTSKELADFVKEHAGPLVADALRDALEPLRKQQTEWGDKIAKMTADPQPPLIQRTGAPGEAFCKYVVAIATAAYKKVRPEDIARGWKDEALAKAIEQGREKALSTVAGADGGYIVPPQFSTDIIEFLRPMSIVRALGPLVIPMPTGTVRIPKLTGGSAASYIGENQNLPNTQPTFGQVVLTFKKLAALVPISNDLLRYSSPGADAIVRDDLVRAMAQRENQAFIRDDGTASTPKGLRYWTLAANALTSAGTWATLANIVTDMGALILALKNANVPMTRPAWLMNPTTWNRLMITQNTNGFFVFREEMMAGRLWGMPFGVSTQVPANVGTGAQSEIYLVDFADAVIGESMNLVVDASMEAAYYDGANVQAAFSLDQTVIRAIMEHDFAMRRQESVAYVTATT